MTTEQIKPSGAWKVSDIIAGVLVWRIYIGYTKRTAQKMFRNQYQKTGAK